MDNFTFRICLLLVLAHVCCSSELLQNSKVKGVLGKKVKFNTTFDGSKPYLTMTWIFGGNSIVTAAANAESVSETYKGRVTFNRTTGTLELGPLTAADNGDYQLSIVIMDGTVKTLAGKTTLEILEPVSTVVITADPPKEAVETNNTVQLTCTAKGSFLKFIWLNGTVPVVADGQRLVLNPSGSILTIKDVQRWDLQKPIYCRVANDLEQDTSAGLNMTVSYGPEKVVLTQTPPDSVLPTGIKVTLSCSSVSSPAATYQWLQNGVAMKDTTASISLDNLNDKNGGNYTCVASNAKTKRYTGSNTVTFAVQEPIKGAKVNREGPATYLLAKNSSITLTCKADAGTAVTKEWTKGGAAVATSDRVTISPEKDKLTIAVVQKEDSGLYKCILTNKVSSQEVNYTVVVNYGPEPVKLEGPKQVEVNDHVVIKCSAESFPKATYTWKLNDTVLPNTNAMYILENPSFRDTGIYTCSAFNALTNRTTSSTHTLFVREEGTLDEGLSGGAIAGIIIGVLIALAIVIGIIMRMRKKKEIPSPY